MTRFVVWAATLVLLAPLASGCACAPAREARRLAGSRATDCGYAPLDGDRSAVVDCLDGAIASEAQAYGGWAVAPTEDRFYVVRPDRTYELSEGGEDGILIAPCLGAPVRVDDSYTCDGELQEPYELCD